MNRALAFVLGLLTCAGAALAHLPVLAARLTTLAEKADLVLIGTATSTRAIDPRQNESEIRVVRLLAGRLPSSPLRFRAHERLRTGGRYLLFLKADPTLRSMAEAGEIFEMDAADDEALSRVLGAVRARLDNSSKRQGLNDALIGLLSARSAMLRYQAALEIERRALRYADLNDSQRRLVAKASEADPVIEPFLIPLLHR